ncbi:hypothetical protein DERP_005822 [Dermatophagoides pteronyssinus]|uniref:Uncharacterized protein n=1 Tax=Dermatophagoides pteronyssinus TaxID=6956 RepID=A0ABQ8J9Q1_DERPT|nr:hypothetical protein DERP_005822 [Dermatophagoides pteronyssinus]
MKLQTNNKTTPRGLISIYEILIKTVNEKPKKNKYYRIKCRLSGTLHIQVLSINNDYVVHHHMNKSFIIIIDTRQYLFNHK